VFDVSFGQTEAQLICGIQKNPGTKDTAMEEQVGLIITPSAAKLLAQMLTLIIESHEKATGAKIPLDQEKLVEMKNMIAAADAARGKVPKKTS
jgi:hypothetical protein